MTFMVNNSMKNETEITLDSIDFNKFNTLYESYLEPYYQGKLNFDNENNFKRNH